MSWLTFVTTALTAFGAIAVAIFATVTALEAYNDANRSDARVERLLEKQVPLPPTRVRFFTTPIDLEERPSSSGVCLNRQSLGTPRSDATRCFQVDGNYIKDPCFLPADAPSFVWVFCPGDPWDERDAGVVVKLDEPQSQGPVTVRDQPADIEPWAMKLENGRRCFRQAGGTALLVADARANYGCPIRDASSPTGFRSGGFIIGNPDRTRDAWIVYFTNDLEEGSIRPVRVVAAVL